MGGVNFVLRAEPISGQGRVYQTQAGSARTGLGGGRKAHRSHLVVSCKVTSNMSSNMLRTFIVLNAGSRMRSSRRRERQYSVSQIVVSDTMQVSAGSTYER